MRIRHASIRKIRTAIRLRAYTELITVAYGIQNWYSTAVVAIRTAAVTPERAEFAIDIRPWFRIIWPQLAYDRIPNDPEQKCHDDDEQRWRPHHVHFRSPFQKKLSSQTSSYIRRHHLATCRPSKTTLHLNHPDKRLTRVQNGRTFPEQRFRRQGNAANSGSAASNWCSLSGRHTQRERERERELLDNNYVHLSALALAKNPILSTDDVGINCCWKAPSSSDTSSSVIRTLNAFTSPPLPFTDLYICSPRDWLHYMYPSLSPAVS